MPDVSKTLKETKQSRSQDRLQSLILAGEQAHMTLRVLPEEVQNEYAKQFKMLADEVEKLKTEQVLPDITPRTYG